MSDRVRIGKTDLYINPIGLGTNAVGGHNIFPNLDDETGREIVRTAIDQGINFIDTAYIYGPERSEELIGEVIREKGKREQLIIATKGAHKYVEDEMVVDNSPAFLRKSIEDSLIRLRTDYIDLFYIPMTTSCRMKVLALYANICFIVFVSNLFSSKNDIFSTHSARSSGVEFRFRGISLQIIAASSSDTTFFILLYKRSISSSSNVGDTISGITFIYFEH